MQNHYVHVLDATLCRRQLSSGGWACLSYGTQGSIEATALAILATRTRSPHISTAAVNFLLTIQHPNGSWPAFIGDDHHGSWVTALALIALGPTQTTPVQIAAAKWLSETSGREGNWFWKWKFRTSDSRVRLDPDKYGWPWHPGTNSWVVPTAFSLLALRQLPSHCGLTKVEERVGRGIDMLLDRVCPSGGWNAGNGMAYGVPLAPHPDDTAIALLALAPYGDVPAVAESVSWLINVAVNLSSPWSLGWALLALAAHQREVSSLADRLASMLVGSPMDDTATLAVGILALGHQSALEYFGVV